MTPFLALILGMVGMLAYRLWQTCSELKDKNALLSEEVEAMRIDGLRQRQESEARERGQKTTIDELTTHCSQLQAFNDELEPMLCTASKESARFQRKSRNLSWAKGMVEDQVKIIIRFAHSLLEQKATREIGEKLIEILRKLSFDAA
jgi:hypothetical protein